MGKKLTQFPFDRHPSALPVLPRISDQLLDVRLKDLHKRLETGLLPRRLDAGSPPRGVLEFHKEGPHGWDGVGVERFNLGGEEGYTHFSYLMRDRCGLGTGSGGGGGGKAEGGRTGARVDAERALEEMVELLGYFDIDARVGVLEDNVRDGVFVLLELLREGAWESRSADGRREVKCERRKESGSGKRKRGPTFAPLSFSGARTAAQRSCDPAVEPGGNFFANRAELSGAR